VVDEGGPLDVMAPAPATWLDDPFGLDDPAAER
jgi:hypothetical protein